MNQRKTLIFLMIFLILLLISLVAPVHSEEECPILVLTLENALSLAINQNRSLINAQDHVTNAEYQVQVVAADFDIQIRPRGDVGYVGGGSLGSGPTIGTGIDISKKIPFGTKFVINPFVTRVNNKYRSNVNITVSQPLLRGFGRDYTLSSLRGAEFSFRTALRGFFISQNGLVLRTITALYEVLKAHKSVMVNSESHVRVERFYQAAVLKGRIGLSDTLDVYRAEVEMRIAEDALKSARDRLQEAEDTLRDILALPSDILIKLELPLKYSLICMELEDALAIALENRVEIEQAEDLLMENERLSCIAKKRLSPELNLVVNYSNLGEDEYFTDSLWGKKYNTWGAGLTTSTDFNPVADRAAYEQSLLAIENANRGLEQAASNVTFDVKRSLRNLERAKERIELQRKQIHSTKGELRLAQIKFDRGMANNFDLISAEKSLRTAELSYWNALIDHIVGEYQLQGVLGILMDKPN